MRSISRRRDRVQALVNPYEVVEERGGRPGVAVGAGAVLAGAAGLAVIGAGTASADSWSDGDDPGSDPALTASYRQVDIEPGPGAAARILSANPDVGDMDFDVSSPGAGPKPSTWGNAASRPALPLPALSLPTVAPEPEPEPVVVVDPGSAVSGSLGDGSVGDEPVAGVDVAKPQPELKPEPKPQSQPEPDPVVPSGNASDGAGDRGDRTLAELQAGALAPQAAVGEPDGPAAVPTVSDGDPVQEQPRVVPDLPSGGAGDPEPSGVDPEGAVGNGSSVVADGPAEETEESRPEPESQPEPVSETDPVVPSGSASDGVGDPGGRTLADLQAGARAAQAVRAEAGQVQAAVGEPDRPAAAPTVSDGEPSAAGPGVPVGTSPEQGPDSAGATVPSDGEATPGPVTSPGPLEPAVDGSASGPTGSEAAGEAIPTSGGPDDPADPETIGGAGTTGVDGGSDPVLSATSLPTDIEMGPDAAARILAANPDLDGMTFDVSSPRTGPNPSTWQQPSPSEPGSESEPEAGTGSGQPTPEVEPVPSTGPPSTSVREPSPTPPVEGGSSDDLEPSGSDPQGESGSEPAEQFGPEPGQGPDTAAVPPDADTPTQVGPGEAPASTDVDLDGSQDEQERARAERLFKAGLFASSGRVVTWQMLKGGIDPSITPGQFAPVAGVDFTKDLILGGALEGIKGYGPVLDPLFNGLRGAALTELVALGTRRGVNPALNAAAGARQRNRVAQSSSTGAAADDASPQRPDMTSPPPDVPSAALPDATIIAPALSADPGRGPAVPENPPVRKPNIRADVIVGADNPRLQEAIPLLDPSRLTPSRDAAINTPEPARLDVTLPPEGPSTPVIGPDGEIVPLPRPDDLYTAAPTDRPVRPFEILPASSTDRSSRRQPSTPLPSRYTDGVYPQGDVNAAQLTDAPSGVRRRAYRANDLTVGSINMLAPALAPALDATFQTVIAARGWDERPYVAPAASAVATGLAVGGPVSLAAGKIIKAAFLGPAAQMFAAGLITEAVFHQLPEEDQRAVTALMEDACMSENAAVMLAKQLTCAASMSGGSSNRQQPPRLRPPPGPPSDDSGPVAGGPAPAPAPPVSRTPVPHSDPAPRSDPDTDDSASEPSTSPQGAAPGEGAAVDGPDPVVFAGPPAPASQSRAADRPVGPLRRSTAVPEGPDIVIATSRESSPRELAESAEQSTRSNELLGPVARAAELSPVAALALIPGPVDEAFVSTALARTVPRVARSVPAARNGVGVASKVPPLVLGGAILPGADSDPGWQGPAAAGDPDFRPAPSVTDGEIEREVAFAHPEPGGASSFTTFVDNDGGVSSTRVDQYPSEFGNVAVTTRPDGTFTPTVVIDSAAVVPPSSGTGLLLGSGGGSSVLTEPGRFVASPVLTYDSGGSDLFEALAEMERTSGGPVVSGVAGSAPPECSVPGQVQCVRPDSNEMVVGSGGPTQQDVAGRIVPRYEDCVVPGQVQCVEPDSNNLVVGDGGDFRVDGSGRTVPRERECGSALEVGCVVPGTGNELRVGTGAPITTNDAGRTFEVVTPAALVEEVRSYTPEHYERAFEQLDAGSAVPTPVLRNPVAETAGEVWENAVEGAATFRENAGNVVENVVEWVGGRAENLWDRRPWKR